MLYNVMCALARSLACVRAYCTVGVRWRFGVQGSSLLDQKTLTCKGWNSIMPVLCENPRHRETASECAAESICENSKYHQPIVKLFPGLPALTKRHKAKYLDPTWCQLTPPSILALTFFLQGCSGVHIHHLSSSCHLFSVGSNITTIFLFCLVYLPLSPTPHSSLNPLAPQGS